MTMNAPKHGHDASRLSELFEQLMGTLRSFIRENRITHDEYRRAVAFLSEVGAERETPLLCDVFLEVTVDEVENRNRPGTATTIEGPYYVPDAPELRSPCALPHRPDEPGPILSFSGTVRSTDGAPLPGAVLDLWQPDSQGRYSHVNIPEADAPYNLRGRVVVDGDGRFEVETRLPGSYEIPKSGPTGVLLTALGRHAWRPAHLHMKVNAAGHRPLTTQLFLKDDPRIDSDVVEGAVKPSLVVEPVRRDGPADARGKGGGAEYCTLTYDFVLEPARARAA
jgi:catechol 1,2-dioxygenase